MSEYIDTRDGWREVREGDDLEGGRDFVTLSFLAAPHHSHHTQKTWVREEPVSTLPTEPYIVIRVSWKDEGDIAENVLTFDGHTWRGGGWAHGPASLALGITGFEVLSEPVKRADA